MRPVCNRYPFNIIRDLSEASNEKTRYPLNEVYKLSHFFQSGEHGQYFTFHLVTFAQRKTKSSQSRQMSFHELSI